MLVKTFYSVMAMIALFFAGAVAYLASQPDYEVRFSREVNSKTAYPVMAKSLDQLNYWPRWFYHLKETTPSKGAPHVGETLRLAMEPKGKEWKRYQLEIKILEFSPGKKLRALLLSDSSGKIPKLFENVEWTVEFTPQKSIVGSLHARTHHWKARVFSSFAGRVLMNQIFYPNLEKLASFKQPFDPDRPEEAKPPSPY